MSNVVYVVIVEESQCQHPRAWTDNFIDPLAMAQNGASLLLTEKLLEVEVSQSSHVKSTA